MGINSTNVQSCFLFQLKTYSSEVYLRKQHSPNKSEQENDLLKVRKQLLSLGSFKQGELRLLDLKPQGF